jgi:hypothetical protein
LQASLKSLFTLLASAQAHKHGTTQKDPKRPAASSGFGFFAVCQWRPQHELDLNHFHAELGAVVVHVVLGSGRLRQQRWVGLFVVRQRVVLLVR